MKRIITLALSIAFLFTINHETKGQDYNSAIGLRLGVYTFANVSYKQFLNESAAFEVYGGGRTWGVFGFRYSRFEVGALYQHHMDLDLEPLPNLRWYVAGGAYAGLYTGNWTGSTGLDLGVMAGPGLDYKFPDLPLNVSLDFYIGLNLIRGGDFPIFGVRQGGLSVRYTLN